MTINSYLQHKPVIGQYATSFKFISSAISEKNKTKKGAEAADMEHIQEYLAEEVRRYEHLYNLSLVKCNNAKQTFNSGKEKCVKIWPPPVV